MELPHIGKHCSHSTCHKLDFLPIKCDACFNVFCHEHMKYVDHMCPKSDERNVQVPVCPICSQPVPHKRGEPPDIAVGEHIDMGCQANPARGQIKIYNNKCSMKGCKQKELVPIICKSCEKNFCITHRHPAEHKCLPKDTTKKLDTPPNSNQRVGYEAIQGNMDEDEALAHAIALSMEGMNRTPLHADVTHNTHSTSQPSTSSKPQRSSDTCVIC